MQCIDIDVDRDEKQEQLVIFQLLLMERQAMVRCSNEKMMLMMVVVILIDFVLWEVPTPWSFELVVLWPILDLSFLETYGIVHHHKSW